MVIQGNPYWVGTRQKSRTERRRKVQTVYNNFDLFVKLNEDIATGKLQIRRFQPYHSCLAAVLPEKKHSNIYK